MSNNKLQSHMQRGFTLVEIMIALLVFMVVMLGVAAGLIRATQANSGNLVRDEALRLAEEELNRLKGERFSVLGTSAALTAAIFPTTDAALAAIPDIQVNIRGGVMSFERVSQVTDLATVATALKRIDVVVGWNDPGGGAVLSPTNRTRQVNLSTIIVRSD